MYFLTKLITRVITPEEIAKPVICGMKYQPIYSALSEKDTMSAVSTFVNNLLVDYGMDAVNFREGKVAKKYELKYHYLTLKIYIAKSEFYKETGCVRVHVEMKYDMKKTYNNAVDQLVFGEISSIYDELYQTVLFVDEADRLADLLAVM